MKSSADPIVRFITRGILILSVAVFCTTSARATTVITGTAQNFSFVVGTALTNQAVATFTDSNAGAVAGDFLATINWGDGTTSAGTITGGPTFTVAGTHTYAAGGTFTVAVTINDVAPGVGTTTVTDTASQLATVIAGTAQNFSFTVGTALTNQVVATFTDSNPAAVAGNFIATINWGDGTTSAGTITGGPTFTVTGTHTYAAGGTFTVAVTINDVAPGVGTTTVTDTASQLTVPTPVMSLPALAGFGLLLAGLAFFFSRRAPQTL